MCGLRARVPEKRSQCHRPKMIAFFCRNTTNIYHTRAFFLSFVPDWRCHGTYSMRFQTPPETVALRRRASQKHGIQESGVGDATISVSLILFGGLARDSLYLTAAAPPLSCKLKLDLHCRAADTWYSQYDGSFTSKSLFRIPARMLWLALIVASTVYVAIPA